MPKKNPRRIGLAIVGAGRIGRIRGEIAKRHPQVDSIGLAEKVPERAKLYSRLHPRCGTSFLLIVMVLAIFVFAPIGLPAWYWLVLSRILGLPLIAGLSYEVIKWAGKNRNKRWVRALMWPGLMLQNLTTREPDEEQLAVAIAALEAVLAVESPREAGEHPIEGEDLQHAKDQGIGEQGPPQMHAPEFRAAVQRWNPFEGPQGGKANIEALVHPHLDVISATVPS